MPGTISTLGGLVGFYYVPIKPRLVRGREAQRVRDALGRNERQAFRNYCYREARAAGWATYWLDQMQGWQIHHAIPISLGGGNSTLALIDPRLHRRVHNQIDAQLNAARGGRQVMIPVKNGPLWL